MPSGEAAVRPRPCPVVARDPLIHLDRICTRPGLYPPKQRGPSRGDSETSPTCLLTKFPSVHVYQVSVEEGKESSRQTGRGRKRPSPGGGWEGPIPGAEPTGLKPCFPRLRLAPHYDGPGVITWRPNLSMQVLSRRETQACGLEVMAPKGHKLYHLNKGSRGHRSPGCGPRHPLRATTGSPEC